MIVAEVRLPTYMNLRISCWEELQILGYLHMKALIAQANFTRAEPDDVQLFLEATSCPPDDTT